MAHRILLIIGFLIAFAAGWGTSLLAGNTSEVSSEWYRLSLPPEETGVNLATEALFRSDINLPNVESISGTAKFTNNNSDTANVHLGYKVAVDVAILDLAKVPAKYKEERQIASKIGKQITLLPITSVAYEVHFIFALRDIDGFTIFELQSKPQSLESGRINTFQNLAPTTIPNDVAARTTAIQVAMLATKCLTCETE
jgi:hypothetical protein